MMTTPTIARTGMGAIPHDGGCAFRVWAPHADAVFVTGDFNDWSEDAAPMQAEEGGFWFADLSDALPGQEYRYRIVGPDGIMSRIDPYAREVTNSVGNAVIQDDAYDWGDDDFVTPDRERLVIYEMHIGTFAGEETDGGGTFADAAGKLDHLAALGVTAVQIMPAAEFAGDMSWGYNPAHIFAVESSYGGPRAFKDFVKAAHSKGIAVILDVVYNHFGPSDLDLWRFDGAGEEGAGGIYFYQDHRAETPWGATRPDYGRAEVRQFIRDNALYWLEAFRLDGLRFDMTLYIRNIAGDGSESDGLPEGWSLMQWVNDEVGERFPRAVTIAEDLRQVGEMTQPTSEGGAGFSSQWDAGFVHPIREVLIASSDEDRSIQSVIDALLAGGDDPFARVVYTESHDEVANGKSRVPHEVNADDQSGWASQKRACLGAVMVMTAPGVPMMFQGQEFLQGDWFDDSVPLDWAQAETFSGLVRLWRDLIHLRTDRDGGSGALCSAEIEILFANEERKCLAYLRGKEVCVVLNLGAKAQRVDLTLEGDWRLRINTDWRGYSPDFGDSCAGDLTGSEEGLSVVVGPYASLIYSR